MNGEQSKNIEELFHVARELSADDRLAYLIKVGNSDPEMRRILEALLIQNDQAQGFLDSPAVELIAASLPAGACIGPYEIVEQIGAGGMGRVYRARDTRLNREVALKTLPPELAGDAQWRTRLWNEASLLASLSHPNVGSIYDVLDIDGVSYLVLEWVSGSTLSDILQRGELPIEQVTNIALQIARALEAAHAKGIVHRDLKPSNVMITDDGHVKVLDFGLAIGSANPLDTETPSGRPRAVHGTGPYMSPEQILGNPVDFRSDIFTFGTVLYEMSTGVRPFEGDDATSVSSSIVSAEPKRPQSLRKGVPADLTSVVQRCLKKHPEQRYLSTRELVEDLKSSYREIQRSRSTPQHRRTYLIVAIAAAVLFALALGYKAFSTTKKQSVTPYQITFLADAKSPSLSPNGKFVAFIAPLRSNESALPMEQVMVQDSSGGRPNRVFSGHPFREVFWSSDGTELIVTGYNGTFVVSAFGPTLSRRIEFPLPFHLISQAPKGMWYAIVSSGKIILTDGKNRQLGIVLSVGFREFINNVKWSPGGDRLLFETFDTSKTAIWAVRTDGSQRAKLAESEDIVAGSAKWGPGGDAIYYLVGDKTRKLSKISFSKETGLATSRPLVVLGDLQSATQFSISGNGKQLVYTRVSKHANFWVADVMPGHSMNAKPLTSSATLDHSPGISPDGLNVAFSRQAGEVSNIFVVPINGGKAKQVTFVNGTASSPVWSREGDRIAFLYKNVKPEIRYVDFSSGNEFHFPGNPKRSIKALAWAPAVGLLSYDAENHTLEVINTENGLRRPLVTAWFEFFSAARIASDGKTVAVSAIRYVRGEHATLSGTRAIWLLSLVGAAEGKWIEATRGNSDIVPIHWNDDGKYIYAVSSGWLVKIGINENEVTRIVRLPMSENIAVDDIDITSDGSRVVYSVSESNSDVWRVDDFDPEVK